MQVTITFDPTVTSEVEDAKKVINAFSFAQQSGDAPATKAAKADKPAAKQAEAPAETPEPKAPAADAPALDIEAVRAAIKDVQALDGKDAAIAILHKYGAKAMSELKPENYAAAYADAKANPKVVAAAKG